MARRIKMKIEKIEFDGRSTNFSYSDTIKTVLSTPGKSGFSVEEVRLSMKIVNKMESSNGSRVKDNITLEDTEWDYLKARLKIFMWGVAHNGIVNLCDAVDNAEKIDI